MKKNLKKILLIINIIFISIISLLNFFYQKDNFNYTLKCITSSIFAILGIINLIYALITKQENKQFYILMSIGIILAMCGDIAINLNFIIGAFLFALAHVLFIIAYYFIQKFRILDLIISAIIFIFSALFLLLYNKFNFDPPMLKWICLIYALIISYMLGKSISNFISKRSLLHVVIMIGCILFYVSDFMLVLDNFAGLWTWTNEACMATYYPALCILAISMYLKTLNKKNS